MTSFHLAHRSHTADWITGPDYKPYEELAVPEGLSIQADEFDGFLAVVLHGTEIGRQGGYRGGEGTRYPPLVRRVGLGW